MSDPSRYGQVVNGRYLLPGPDGKPLSLQRVTNFLKVISDTYNLDLWQKRMVVKGIGLRPDLYVEAAATPLEDRETLNRIADDAKEFAGGSTAANTGKALHNFIVAVNSGIEVEVPPPWNKDIEAYVECLKRHNITPLAEYSERIVICKDLMVAGRFDNLCRLIDNRLVVTDNKTGQSMDFGHLDMAIQLAIYANGDAIWNDQKKCYEAMPEGIDKKEGLIIHVPAEKGVACVKSVDIEEGYRAAKVCAAIHGWRRKRNLMKDF